MTLDPQAEQCVAYRPKLDSALWEIFPDGFMLFRSVRDAGRIVDFEWVYTNPAAARIVGRSHVDLLGKRFTVEMPGSVEAGLFGAYRRVVESGEPHRHELEYAHEGLDRVLRSSAVKAKDGFAVWFSDVTDRRHVERMLAANIEHTTSLVESLGEALLSFDGEMRFLVVNGAAERLLRRSRAELIGRCLWEEFPAMLGTEFEEHYRRVLATRSPTEFEAPFPSLDLWLEVRAYPTPDGLKVLARDVTDRKRMQEQLRVADHMVSVATMAAGVAHEINNPLSYVISNLDYLQEELAELRRRLAGYCKPAGDDCAVVAGQPVLDEMVTAIEDARDGAGRVRKIVRDLDSFSRQAGGARDPVDVWRVLDASIGMTMHEIDGRARLVRDAQPVPPVLGSASQLGQVFVNLLANAARAIPPGFVEDNEIRVSTRERAGKVVVRVTDTGQGIQPDHLKRVFSPFFTTKPVGQGSGLGLTICHNIVSSMGGEISVRRSDGRGTVLEVVLPSAAQVKPAQAGV